MSTSCSGSFQAYQELLRHIDEETAVSAVSSTGIMSAADVQSGMDEFISAVMQAEKSLQNVMSVKNSYNEIIKMIM